jgi:hypothetical protein
MLVADNFCYQAVTLRIPVPGSVSAMAIYRQLTRLPSRWRLGLLPVCRPTGIYRAGLREESGDECWNTALRALLGPSSLAGDQQKALCTFARASFSIAASCVRADGWPECKPISASARRISRL